MKLLQEQLDILEILEENHQVSTKSIAEQLQLDEEEVKKHIKQLEQDGIIVSYPALIDWSKIEGKEAIVAMVDVKVTPKRGVGFDEVAERIYRYPEVKSLYLISGTYDLSVSVEGKSMKDIALFISEKLSTIESVNSTTTHIMMKKYKNDGVIMEGDKDDDRRMVITP